MVVASWNNRGGCCLCANMNPPFGTCVVAIVPILASRQTLDGDSMDRPRNTPWHSVNNIVKVLKSVWKYDGSEINDPLNIHSPFASHHTRRAPVLKENAPRRVTGVHIHITSLDESTCISDTQITTYTHNHTQRQARLGCGATETDGKWHGTVAVWWCDTLPSSLPTTDGCHQRDN